MSTQQLMRKNPQSEHVLNLPVNGIPIRKQEKLTQTISVNRYSWEDIRGLGWIIDEERI